MTGRQKYNSLPAFSIQAAEEEGPARHEAEEKYEEENPGD